MSQEFNSQLFRAVETGDVEAVEKALDAGADKEARNVDGFTPLHRAVWVGHVGIVCALISSGANKEAVYSEHGLRPIHLAAIRNKEEVMGTLLRAGVDKDALDSTGRSALLYAEAMEGRRIFEMLIAAGVKDKFGRSSMGY